MSKAIYGGAFDPIHKGHAEIVSRAFNIFDEVLVMVADNSNKKHLFDIKKRVEMAEKVFADWNGVSVISQPNMTIVEYASKHGYSLLRGLRNTNDFVYEAQLEQGNKLIELNVETVFLMTNPVFSAISSSLVRELMLYKPDIITLDRVVPTAILDDIVEMTKSIKKV